MRIVLVILILGILLGAYLFYVRGGGVQPELGAPQVIERQGGARAYAWTQKAEMPTARTEVTAAVRDGKVYVIGGLDGFARTVATVEVYDTATDDWRSAPDLPEARHHAVAVTVGDTLYVIGGFTGTGFEPKPEVFALKVQGTWQRVVALPEARGALAAAVVDNRILVVGGVGPQGLANDLFVYEPALDAWTKKTPAPTRRDHLAAGALGGLLYVAGGREKSLSKNLSTLEVYDSASDTWHAGPGMPTARGGVAGAVFDGLFVVAGGEQPGGTFREVEAFDPVANDWLSLPPLPTPRHGLAAAAVGNTLYIIGGGKKPGLSVSGSNEALEAR